MKEVVKYIFEIGQLKRVKRSGWWIAGIDDPESVAEHSHRAGIIAYVLGKMEKADASKAMIMTFLHDTGEARVLDLHKISQKYVDSHDAEFRALRDQVSRLPSEIRDEFIGLYQEYKNESSKEGMIAKDADLLECAFQAKEYVGKGHKEAEDWFTNVGKLLKTKSALALYKQLKKQHAHTWWKGLKKIGR